MRIGVMLRHYDQHGGGVRVYTKALLDYLISHPAGHEYVLFFRNPALLGTYRAPHVTEVCVGGRSVLTWDQVGLPRALRRHGVDLLFNPKYSVPLSGGYPAVWVCHGLDWYVMPWASRLIDRLSHRFLVPRYAARASAVIAVSEVTREHVIEFLHVPPERVTTVYTAIEDLFRVRLDENALSRVRRSYDLPERYVLYAGAVYPPKNFTRMATLAAFYQAAQALLMPSLFESFGLPIVEAMASGCPVVTSNCYGAKEVATDAALLVDPTSVAAIAEGLERVLTDAGLRQQLIERGFVRSSMFTWERCGNQTLRILERAAGA
jgi:glycosyltransferase involved in cell wall biosynthesis